MDKIKNGTPTKPTELLPSEIGALPQFWETAHNPMTGEMSDRRKFIYDMQDVGARLKYAFTRLAKVAGVPNAVVSGLVERRASRLLSELCGVLHINPQAICWGPAKAEGTAMYDPVAALLKAHDYPEIRANEVELREKITDLEDRLKSAKSETDRFRALLIQRDLPQRRYGDQSGQQYGKTSSTMEEQIKHLSNQLHDLQQTVAAHNEFIDSNQR